MTITLSELESATAEQVKTVTTRVDHPWVPTNHRFAFSKAGVFWLTASTARSIDECSKRFNETIVGLAGIQALVSVQYKKHCYFGVPFINWDTMFLALRDHYDSINPLCIVDDVTRLMREMGHPLLERMQLKVLRLAMSATPETESQKTAKPEKIQSQESLPFSPQGETTPNVGKRFESARRALGLVSNYLKVIQDIASEDPEVQKQVWAFVQTAGIPSNPLN